MLKKDFSLFLPLCLPPFSTHFSPPSTHLPLLPLPKLSFLKYPWKHPVSVPKTTVKFWCWSLWQSPGNTYFVKCRIIISLRNLIDKTKYLQRKTIDIAIFFHVSLKRKDVFMVQEKAQTFKLGSLGRWKTGKMTDVLQMGSKYILPEWDTACNSKNLCVILENKKNVLTIVTNCSLKLLQKRIIGFEDDIEEWQWNVMVKMRTFRSVLRGPNPGSTVLQDVTLGKLLNSLNLFFLIC